MLYSAEPFMLRDGGRCVIRSAEPEDAEQMLQYMKIMLGETPFLLRTPEEFDYSVEEEARILEGRKNDPRSLMLLAEKDGKIIACADVLSRGIKKPRLASHGAGHLCSERLLASGNRLCFDGAADRVCRTMRL